MAILSLDDFKFSADIVFSKGTWLVEYHDETHLPGGKYIRLGSVEIEECTPNGACFFRFYPACIGKLVESIENVWKRVKGKHDVAKAAQTILNQLGESMVRLGLLQPHFEVERRASIADGKSAIVILDTNALRNGAVRHLHEQFKMTRIWIIIPTVALMEIGERLANITSMATGDPKQNKISIIRTRPQVTIAPQEVEWIKKWFPTETLELAPELMRAFRGYESMGNRAYKEPDRFSINDRLILEGIKELRRQRNLSEEVYLMSGDKDMSRLARLEGIQTIYPEIPKIQEVSDGIYSMRYSFQSKAYVVCSIHRFLWDLTHVFSKIRVRECAVDTENTEQVELFYYYPTKLVNDWVDDKLEVTCCGSSSTTDDVRCD